MQGMSPNDFFRFQRYHAFHHHFHRVGFFRRFFWFGLGAGAMAWWKHAQEQRTQAEQRGLHGREWRSWCSRHNQQQIQAAPEYERSYPQSPVNNGQQQYAPPPIVAAPVPVVESSNPVTPSFQLSGPLGHGFSPENFKSFEQTQQEFRAHQQSIEKRFNEVMRQTGDTMSRVSENAVDSLLASVQELKKKLAEGRELREKEKLHLEQTLPETNDKTTKVEWVDNSRLV